MHRAGDTLLALASERDAAIAERDALAKERDEADRRAGAAERRLADEKDTASKRTQWLRKAKASLGYHDNTSFDKVWKDVTDAAAERDAAIAARDAMANVLHRISLGAQNSMTQKEDLGRLARAALAAAPGDTP